MSYIVTKQLKSTGLAVFLAILFGGIGLFYASILGGIIMSLVFPVVLFFLFFTGHFALAILLACSYYIICGIWAIVGVSSYNKKIKRNAALNPVNKIDLLANEDSLGGDKYYEEYRKSQRSDNTILWLLLTIVLTAVVFYIIIYAFNSMAYKALHN